MLRLPHPQTDVSLSLDRLDRAAIAYVMLPLFMFLVGWFEWWAAAPLVLCTVYALKPLAATPPLAAFRLPLTRGQIAVAILVGCGWTLFAGAGHVFFANADWHVRDAVLHDLVVSPWPVGYGLVGGLESMLRAPVGFYLPAALVGKALGLPAAHVVMALWTAAGAALFILQVLSLVPARAGAIALTAAVIVLFSGFDIVGAVINTGPRFLARWDIAQHLEWWAGSYQYSSMTTQLFWVPNHALAAWLLVGLMSRHLRASSLDVLLPVLAVAAALWSPLSAAGLVPFILWRAFQRVVREGRLGLLHPKLWAPAVLVGVVVAAYLVLDPGGIAKGVTLGGGTMASTVVGLARQAQFFLLEAGFIGAAVLWIRRSGELWLALILLALLPLAYFGPGNDLVMRGSIPSLAVLAIGACRALAQGGAEPQLMRKKIVLVCLLAIGAVTPVQEFARAVELPSWPINLRASLIGTNCNSFPPHYVARLGGQAIRHLMRAPHRLVGTLDPRDCDNPAIDLMWRHGLL